MNSSRPIGAFIAGLIDYAGLFPPARLSLEKAFDGFFSYEDHPQSEMLSHFILPANKLAEAKVLLQKNHGDSLKRKSISFSLLLDPIESIPNALENARTVVHSIKDFQANWESEACIFDAFEMPIAPAALSKMKNTEYEVLLREMLSVLRQVHQNLCLYLEVDLKAEKSDFLSALGNHYAIFPGSVAVKIRTGGITASAVPNSHDVAKIISQVQLLSLPMKATAGLHHIVRHFDSDVNAKMYGFLNIFTAIFMARKYKASEAMLIEVLENENVTDFSFSESHFTYQKEYTWTQEDVIQFRKLAGVSFGSCSFLEPIEHLNHHHFL